MRDAQASTRYALYALFTLSGFAGLIYESIWSHYLKLFLGHAAYAQTLVLMIYMGGMALGAWLAGEWSHRVARPLVAYAAIEGLLGVFALGFDALFRGLQAWAFDHAIPALESPLAIDLLKWTLSAAVILPQSVLLGMTFPLMSAGVLRLAAGSAGGVLAWLYFTNSLGASVGVLASGFVLIARFGLAGTIMAAGLINFLLVFGVWLIARRQTASPAVPAAVSADTASRVGLRLMLATAFLTGAASFCYEIGWIRMLSLVLGAATHSFELMLSAFILGLALGSFFIRARIERLGDPLRALGAVQVAMAVLALATVVLYPVTFDLMAALLESVARNDAGYTLYMLLSHGICLALMLPVTICAGMTLPLITHLLLKSGQGEAAIGRVYAANTVGAIVGVLLAVHVIMPLLGLRQVIVIGAAIDLALGLWLLRASPRTLPAAARGALAVALVAAVGVIVAAPFDPARLASGVYRSGEAVQTEAIVFHYDGKTASIDVFGSDEKLSIATNGKVDAGLRHGPEPSVDDPTMILLAAVPALAHPQPRTVAVIGFGSGRTTHVLLQDARIERVDTIEIEPGMVEGARTFGDLVSAAYTDPRSRIHIEDAKTWFARGGARYDVIISEPSNPWVSGVASLFSREFYQQARRHLNEGGVLVQWLQLYESDLSIVGSVLKALGSQFEDYQVYSAGVSDVLVIASVRGPVPEPAWSAAAGGLARLMAHVDVRGAQDLAALRVGGRRELEPLMRTLPLPANSDYFPVVDQRAARFRFLDGDAMGLLKTRRVISRLAPQSSAAIALTPARLPLEAHEAQAVARAYGAGFSGAGGEDVASGTLLVLRALPQACGTSAVAKAWLVQFQDIVPRLVPYLGAAAGRAVAAVLRRAPCYGRLPAQVRDWIDLFERAAAGDAAARPLALKLLAEHGDDHPTAEFLLAEALLVSLRQRDTSLEQARRWGPALWARKKRSPALTLLMAHLAQGETPR